MNFIGELSVLLSGTIIRPTKINDMNTDGKKKKKTGGKRRNMNIYTKKKLGEKEKGKEKYIQKRGKEKKESKYIQKNLSLAIYTDNLK